MLPDIDQRINSTTEMVSSRSTHGISIMEDRLALERRRERNRLAQRRHRENLKLHQKGTRQREPNFECSTSEQATAGNRSRCLGTITDPETLPFSAFLGSGLDYSMDQLSSENLFSDMLLTPEYNHLELTYQDLPVTHDLNKSVNPSSLCANCHACANPQFQPSSANTPTRPSSHHDPKRSSWTTPLHISVSGGHLSAVRLLLDRGADPNAVDGQGSTVLHTAVRSGHHTIVQELLQHNADPSVVDAAGWLPLHYAAEAGDENSLRALLQT